MVYRVANRTSYPPCSWSDHSLRAVVGAVSSVHTPVVLLDPCQHLLSKSLLLHQGLLLGFFVCDNASGARAVPCLVGAATAAIVGCESIVYAIVVVLDLPPGLADGGGSAGCGVLAGGGCGGAFECGGHVGRWCIGRSKIALSFGIEVVKRADMMGLNSELLDCN
jgi:hypothetical protein